MSTTDSVAELIVELTSLENALHVHTTNLRLVTAAEEQLQTEGFSQESSDSGLFVFSMVNVSLRQSGDYEEVTSLEGLQEIKDKVKGAISKVASKIGNVQRKFAKTVELSLKDKVNKLSTLKEDLKKRESEKVDFAYKPVNYPGLTSFDGKDYKTVDIKDLPSSIALASKLINDYISKPYPAAIIEEHWAAFRTVDLTKKNQPSPLDVTKKSLVDNGFTLSKTIKENKTTVFTYIPTITKNKGVVGGKQPQVLLVSEAEGTVNGCYATNKGDAAALKEWKEDESDVSRKVDIKTVIKAIDDMRAIALVLSGEPIKVVGKKVAKAFNDMSEEYFKHIDEITKQTKEKGVDGDELNRRKVIRNQWARGFEGVLIAVLLRLNIQLQLLDVAIDDLIRLAKNISVSR